jgi:hypothetical protein
VARFDSAIALAIRLLAKNGQNVTLRGFTPGAPVDPTKPWRPSANTASNQTVKAVFLDYEQKYIDGTTIQSGDQKALLPSVDILNAAIAPELEGLVVRGSELWRILDVGTLAPNGQTIMFELQLRR